MLSTLFDLLVGYAICVLFPMPWLSQWVIWGWARLWASIKGTAA